jgi:hypothetical protein
VLLAAVPRNGQVLDGIHKKRRRFGVSSHLGQLDGPLRFEATRHHGLAH